MDDRRYNFYRHFYEGHNFNVLQTMRDFLHERSLIFNSNLSRNRGQRRIEFVFIGIDVLPPNFLIILFRDGRLPLL